MLRSIRLTLFCALLSLGSLAAQQKKSAEPAADAQAKPDPAKNPPAQPAKKLPDAETELQRAVEQAGNDRAALLRNLEDYLRRFPDATRKQQVYRAIVEAAMQLRDSPRALDYAERIIALRPDDDAMMLFAVELLQQNGDDPGLTRAVGYATRVIDRVEKSPETKPVRVSQSEWELERKKVLMSVYLIRGRLQMKRRKYDEAVADLETSYKLVPNPAAALHLGEIAEVRKDTGNAIDRYVAAFVLPDQPGLNADRWEVRRKLGNLWQLAHGSDAGLGERLLQAYDKLATEPKTGAAAYPAYNKGATEPFAFVLRRPDDPAPLKLAAAKGKILVLNFWATWCLPCRELEPLFERAGRQYEGKPDVMFLAVNNDEDETRVKPFLEQEKMRVPVVFADGLDLLLNIKAYPTVLVLDRTGKIIYRVEGYDPEGFITSLTAAIERALAGTS